MANSVILSRQLLEVPLEGVRLPAPTLGEILHQTPLVWVQFLRHLGCIYCKGLVEDIRLLVRSWGEGPTPYLIFIHPNTLAEGEVFFARYYPDAPHIADPHLRLYRAFRVHQAKPWHLLSLTTLRRFWELLRRGHTNDRPNADPLVLHASFLFYHETLIWTYYAKTPGDTPRWPRQV